MTETNSIQAVGPAADPTRFDGPGNPRDAVLRHTAQEFETVFLTEMLKHAGVGKMTEGFNGGPGEAAFTGLLTQEYAREIVRSGGLGLADGVYHAMKRMDG